MTVFPDWQKYAVRQRQELTGCIPTGYEILLRAAGVSGVNFNTFQEDFDLEYQKTGRNDFHSVLASVTSKYPHVTIEIEAFTKGSEKLKFVESQLARRIPTLVSVSWGTGNGWHIMPVVDADTDHLILLHDIDLIGKPNTIRITKSDFEYTHDNLPGGEEVAFIA